MGSSVIDEIWETVWRNVRDEMPNVSPHEVRSAVMGNVEFPLDQVSWLVWNGVEVES